MQIGRALSVMTVAKKVEHSIKGVRSRLAYDREPLIEEREIREYIAQDYGCFTEEKKRRAREYYASMRRWEKCRDVWHECSIAKFEACALYGDNVRNGFKVLEGVIFDLENAIRQYLNVDDRDEERLVKYRQDIYIFHNADAFGKRVEEAVAQIEKVLQPYLKPQSK